MVFTALLTGSSHLRFQWLSDFPPGYLVGVAASAIGNVPIISFQGEMYFFIEDYIIASVHAQ